MCLSANSSPVNSCQFTIIKTGKKKNKALWGMVRGLLVRHRSRAVKTATRTFHIASFFLFLEGVFLLNDQTRLLLLSNGDEAGGGQSFVLLVTLITPWGISIVLFSSFSVLISPLPADSSALITVFILPYVTRPKISSFWGQLCKNS